MIGEMKKNTINRSLLPSGVRVVSEKVEGSQSIAVGIWINSGSRDESEDKSGFTHFLEHMVFKGTPKWSAKDIAFEFDSMGGDLNAATGKEYTCFYARILSENLEKSLEIMFDMIKNPLLDPTDISNEIQVVLEEIAMHNDSPDELVLEYLARALWGNHPAGKSVLGSAETIQKITREKLMEFHKNTYVSSRMIISAAGNLDHEKLCELVLTHTEDIPKGEPPQRRNIPKFNPNTIIVNKKTEQAHLSIGSHGLPAGHEDRFALAVADNILGGSMSSRLFQIIREEKGLAYSVYSFNTMLTGCGLVGIYCGTSPSQTKEVVGLIERILDDIRERGFESEEMDRAKNHLKGSLLICMEDNSNRMNRLAKAELAGLELLTVDEVLARIMKVSLKDIDKVFAQTWGENKRGVAIVGPFEDK